MNDSQHATQDDETKIHAAALDYIDGVLEADPARMERCLHPRVGKAGLPPGRGGKPQLSHVDAEPDTRREDLEGHSQPACRGRYPRSLRGIGERSNHVRQLD
jgi:hypothetical protein